MIFNDSVIEEAVYIAQKIKVDMLDVRDKFVLMKIRTFWNLTLFIGESICFNQDQFFHSKAFFFQNFTLHLHCNFTLYTALFFADLDKGHPIITP